MYPYQARKKKTTYGGKIYADVTCTDVMSIDVMSTNSGQPTVLYGNNICLGEIPVYVGSKLCHLQNAVDATVVMHKEERFQIGAYFVIRGSAGTSSLTSFLNRKGEGNSVTGEESIQCALCKA